MRAPCPSPTEIRKRFARGSEVFRQGDQGDCAYLVECGAVEISVERGGEQVVLATRNAGEILARWRSSMTSRARQP
ncbi:MAG: cyclic nucleotide-binding domain-containing protein [Neomegalonema sp.]|nr:cyclic nucleotide-binding domain-containing protein [Neomegalonema sp.]